MEQALSGHGAGGRPFRHDNSYADSPSRRAAGSGPACRVPGFFGPPARLDYRAFVQAVEVGALVKELESGAAVSRLLVENPTDLPLLVYEGEEVLGAQQNRLFDELRSRPAGERLELQVSCVEQGRWDHRRHREAMRPSPQAADPSLRRRKRQSIEQQGHADQGEVWASVGGRLADHAVASASAAMSDLYDSRRGDLRELSAVVHHVDGQVGALACMAGVPVALDSSAARGVRRPSGSAGPGLCA